MTLQAPASCSELPAKEMKTDVTPNGLCEKQKISSKNKRSSPWTGDLLANVIRTYRRKIVVGQASDAQLDVQFAVSQSMYYVHQQWTSTTTVP